MRSLVLVAFFLLAVASAIGQSKYYSAEQNRLEQCSFDESDASRYSCYSEVLNDIFLEELNNYYASLDLSAGDVLQDKIRIRLTPEGQFELVSIETDNDKIRALVERRVEKMERVIPVKNRDTDDEFGDFDMILAFHVADDGALLPGLPKQTVGGFDDLVETVDFEVIENVPVYPGCTGETNEELKKCMSKKVQDHVIRRFNLGLANTLGLPAGIQRVYVRFKVDREGKVANVDARAAHPALAEEAKRVVQLLPQMKPGMQKGKEVGVLYSLPIVFKVEETKKQRRERLKREKEARKKM